MTKREGHIGPPVPTVASATPQQRTMASFVSYTGNGTTKDFAVPFPYLDPAHVKTTVDGVLTEAWTWLDSATISFTAAPASGTVVRIYRQTPVSERLASFTNGEALLDEELNVAAGQALYVAEEAADQAADATEIANDATEIANDANIKAAGAVYTANVSYDAATSAVNTANTASETANNALALIEAAVGIGDLDTDLIENASDVPGASLTNALDTLRADQTALVGTVGALEAEVETKAAAEHTHTAGEVSGLATVATTGSYNDLANKPTLGSMAALAKASQVQAEAGVADNVGMTPLKTAQAIAALVSGAFVGVSFYTSSQTVTIPAGATRALVQLVGGAGGGSGRTYGGGGGGAGGLLKLLAGLLAGNTLVLTIGAGGTASTSSGNAGGASTLASGTQSITTLTANGGGGASDETGGAGGTATNGDLNVTGQIGGTGAKANAASLDNRAEGGMSAFGLGRGGMNTTGTPGVCIIWWFK